MWPWTAHTRWRFEYEHLWHMTWWSSPTVQFSVQWSTVLIDTWLRNWFVYTTNSNKVPEDSNSRAESGCCSKHQGRQWRCSAFSMGGILSFYRCWPSSMTGNHHCTLIWKCVATFLPDAANENFIRGIFYFKKIQTVEYREGLLPGPPLLC